MKKSRDTTLALTTDYKQFVTDLKSRIASARLAAARHVNRELVTLYWDIGRGIVEKQKELNWGESLWLSQALMAELFQVTVPTVNEHLKGIYAKGELAEAATMRKFRMVRTEGRREVTREIEHYSLEPILAVGYRVLHI